jgi:hypothetical protein
MVVMVEALIPDYSEVAVVPAPGEITAIFKDQQVAVSACSELEIMELLRAAAGRRIIEQRVSGQKEIVL